jgi:uncharacterized membrane protein YecN with MAPEG domain
MVGLSEVLMMAAVVVQAVVVVGIAFVGVRMVHRYGFGHRTIDAAPRKPLDL